jgi:hypothetical protein
MAWKSMTPKQRMMAEKELREHRKAINEQEDHMHNTSSGSNDSWRNGMNMSDQRAINAFSETPRALKLLSERFPSSYFNQESVENTCPGWSANTRDYRPGSTTTHFAAKNEPEQDPTMPEDVGIYGEEQHPEDTLTIEQLRKKMMNVGQTKPQLPLREQPAIKKLPMDKAFHTFGRKIFFDGDQNGRVHSQSGQFVPAVDGQSPQAVQNAYNPLKRKTGVSPFKNKLAKAALRRV